APEPPEPPSRRRRQHIDGSTVVPEPCAEVLRRLQPGTPSADAGPDASSYPGHAPPTRSSCVAPKPSTEPRCVAARARSSKLVPICRLPCPQRGQGHWHLESRSDIPTLQKQDILTLRQYALVA